MKNDGDKRNLASAGAQPIRITVDSSNLENGSVSDLSRTYVRKIVSVAVNFLKKLIKVIPFASNNIYSNGSSTICIDLNVPLEDRTTGIPDSDLHLYISYYFDTAPSTVANGGWCSLYQSTMITRPNFGRV